MRASPISRPQHAVDPFPKEDEFESGQTHSRVYFAVFGRCLIFGKRFGPSRLTHRGEHSANGLPLSDRQAGFSQPRNPANDNDRDHHRSDEEQPLGDEVGACPVHYAASAKRAAVSWIKAIMLGMP